LLSRQPDFVDAFARSPGPSLSTSCVKVSLVVVFFAGAVVVAVLAVTSSSAISPNS
jgi:hypothetical protein